MLDLDMSPYAAFVWPAWAVTAAVLAGLVLRALMASRRWRAELKRMETADAERPRAADVAEGLEE